MNPLTDISKWLKALASMAEHARSVFTKDGLKAVGQFFYNHTLAILQGFQILAHDAAPYLQPFAATFVSAFNQYGGPIYAAIFTPISNFVQAQFNLVDANLRAGGLSTPTNAVSNAGKAMASAFAAGISSAGVTAAFEAIFPEKLNTLNGIGPMLAQSAGFDQVAKAALGPMYDAAFGEALKQQYMSQFRPMLLSPEAAREAFRRRLITQAQFESLLSFYGLSPSWVPTEEAVAYRPIAARLLATAMDDTEFNTTLFTKVFQNNGYSDADVATMTSIVEYAANKTARKELRQAAENLYVQGLYTQQQFEQAVGYLQINPQALALYESAATMKRLLLITENYKKGWDAQVLKGQVNLNDYRVALAALGYSSPVIDSLVGELTQRLDAIEYTAEQAIEKTQRRQQQEVAVQAAMRGFKDGTLNLIELTASLVAAGLPATLAGEYAALAQARGQIPTKQTVLHFTPGQNLAIKAADEEYYKGVISTATYEAQLAAIGVPAADIQYKVSYQNARGAAGQSLGTGSSNTMIR